MNKDQQRRHSAYLEGKKIGLKGYWIKEGRRYRRWKYFTSFRSGWKAGLKARHEEQEKSLS